MKPARVVVVLALAAAAAGCASRTVGPKTFGAEAPELSFATSGTVAVSARPLANPHPRFTADGITFEIDLQEMGAHLAELVGESLRDSGATVGAGGKTVELEMVFMDYMAMGPCFVDYNVQLGNGQSFGQQSRGDDGNYVKSCRQALEAAVPLILQDSRTVAYFGEV